MSHEHYRRFRIVTKAILPADLDARKYGGTDVKDPDAVVRWVTDPENYNRIKRLIVIDVPVKEFRQNKLSV